ncbi:hypothetical protein EVAR_7620_1 [Eumeta japonica]|uniref:Uncharacterized protein n=1 Tax=Eumeta variegata TaxID=151549 RepID=A0A4C1TLC8_EUMVA|nr:hypothetical protein EVAR_7620_1 [Eumeta japonica]
MPRAGSPLTAAMTQANLSGDLSRHDTHLYRVMIPRYNYNALYETFSINPLLAHMLPQPLISDLAQSGLRDADDRCHLRDDNSDRRSYVFSKAWKPLYSVCFQKSKVSLCGIGYPSISALCHFIVVLHPHGVDRPHPPPPAPHPSPSMLYGAAYHYSA